MDGGYTAKLSEYRTCTDGGRLTSYENYPLSDACTFRIGGSADIAVWPSDTEALVYALRAALDCGQRYVVIGSGSNVLFDDLGYRGAVIFTGKMKSVSVEGNIIDCDAGASMSALALAAKNNALEGLEFAYGIPGTVGGGVYMNAGAYGGQISDVLLKSSYFDPSNGDIGTLDAESHEFDYRHSSYEESGRIILTASFLLRDGNSEDIWAKMEANRTARQTKQPLDYPSAGSVFKRYPGFYTAALIDGAGLKGMSVGGAQVSEKHAGFIINRGGATSRDVRELICLIKSKIREIHGIDIECEIKYVGP